MKLQNWFTFLKKNEPVRKRNDWVIDETKCLSDSEIIKLRKFTDDLKRTGLKKRKFNKIRNWFMIELALNAGLRVQEMANLKHNNLLIHETKSSIVLIGKGKKKRTVWISSKFKKTCLVYIRLKKHYGYSISEDSYLLNNLSREGITKRALQKFFKKIAWDSGISHHYSIHSLRHTYSTSLLKASNYNYRFVQSQLGHSSIRTTQIYASVVESDGRMAIEKLYQ
jgi:site-specific recombinase XerD